MAWRITDDVHEWLAEAGGFLRAQRTLNTLMLTVAESVRTHGGRAYGKDAPLFGWWRPAATTEGGADSGPVEGAFLQTPPYPTVLTDMPAPAVPELAQALHERGAELPGANAGPSAAEAFASAWKELTGSAMRLYQRHRLYQLTELVPPSPMPEGAPRIAGPADRELLVAWCRAFGEEADEASGSAVERIVDERIDHGGMMLWEVDGTPVCLVSTNRPVAGMVRIGPVYTPPGLRGRGFAGAATAEACRAATAAGTEEVLLFADLANATSNALYQRLGFRAVGDRLVLVVD